MVQKICKACGTELIPGKVFCPNCLVRIPDVPDVPVAPTTLVVPVAANKKQYPKDTPENRAKKLKEYKVVGMEEVWNPGGGGRFNKRLIEDTLNSYGSEGWCVKEIATRQIPGIASFTYEIIIILERDMPLEPS
jgi:hypothetical protein